MKNESGINHPILEKTKTFVKNHKYSITGLIASVAATYWTFRLYGGYPDLVPEVYHYVEGKITGEHWETETDAFGNEEKIYNLDIEVSDRGGNIQGEPQEGVDLGWHEHANGYVSSNGEDDVIARVWKGGEGIDSEYNKGDNIRINEIEQYSDYSMSDHAKDMFSKFLKIWGPLGIVYNTIMLKRNFTKLNKISEENKTTGS